MEKFKVARVEKSKQWPAWKGTTAQVHLTIKKKGKFYHLYVPASDPIGKVGKGSRIDMHFKT